MDYRVRRRQFLRGSVLTGAFVICDTYFRGIKSVLASNKNLLTVGLIEANDPNHRSKEFNQGVALALKEINSHGGILGKLVDTDYININNDNGNTEELIASKNINTWFGDPSWLKVASTNDLFWSPLIAQENNFSPNTFYMGATPNQQIEPAINWLLENKGGEISFVGTDDQMSRISGAIVKQQLKSRGGQLLGEIYLPNVSESLNSAIEQLPKGGIIITTLQGVAHKKLFQSLQEVGGKPQNYSVMSLGLTEADINTMGQKGLEGHYTIQNYLSSLNTPENRQWVKTNQQKLYGDGESGYSLVYLWKQAVETAQTTTDIEKIRQAAIGQNFTAPEGNITIANNQHIVRTPFIGRVTGKSNIELVDVASKTPVTPITCQQYAIALTGSGSPNFQHWSYQPPKGKTKLASRNLWRGFKTPSLA